MRIKRLTKQGIETLPDGLHADGGNLYLRKRGQARSWVFRYKLKGKVHEIGLGSAWVLPLPAARKKAMELRVGIANGVLPMPARKVSARSVTALAASTVCLDDLVIKAIDLHASSGKVRGPKYAREREAVYRNHISPVIGKVPLASLRTIDVANVLNDHVPPGGVAIALSIIRLGFSYAKASGLFSGESPVSKDSGLSSLLRKRSAPRHFPAIPWQELPAVYKKLSESTVPGAKFLRCLMLTTNRFSELAAAKASMWDSETLVLTIPQNKTSATPVQFPVPRQAAVLFGGSGEYLFTAPSGIKMTNTHAMKTLKAIAGNRSVTMHGFRSSFSTWCADNGKDSEIRERCLGHVVDNKVAASYQRSDLLERRRALLQEWADYVTGSCTSQQT